jgi:nucleotide-binding universal stress UspA family protein
MAEEELQWQPRTYAAMRFQKILFPTDFSEPCDRIAPCVAAVQRIMYARLTLLHATDAGVSTNGPATERLRQFARRHFCSNETPDPPDLVVEPGGAAQAIAGCVEARQIDLVMMPTHGYGAFRRALLGSVTTKVLHDLNCAVWTAAHAEKAPVSAVRHILCGIDEPESSVALLASAVRIAAAFGATLRIVHAYPDFAGTPEERYARVLPPSAESSIRNKMETLQERAGVSVPVVVARGEVNDVIAETARRCEADLVIAGHGSFGGFLVGVRSHLYYVIRSSPCPVLVLPEGKEE